MNNKSKIIQPLSNFSKPTLVDAMKRSYAELLEFASLPQFQDMLDELYSLAPAERPDFVNNVIMNSSKMAERGLSPPADILIQRSSFGDRRPTLFCIKKYIEEHLQTHWQNVNITFDNLYSEEEVPRGEEAWRVPLPFDLQQALVSEHITEHQIDRMLEAKA